MRELGYEEGSDFELLYRFSDGYADRIPSLAQEVVQLKPDVILATAPDTAVAVRKLSTIPIVTGALADPVELGLIASEARPGGNVTGIEPYVPGLPAKQMELAREIVPGASKIGLLTNLQDPKAPPQAQELTAAGKALEIEIVTADASRPEEIDGALHALMRQQVDIVVVLQTSMLLSERDQIIAWELANKLPMVFGYPQYTRAGGLVSYGVDLPWCFYRTAYFVDKILRGTAPGDLPVEFPSKMLLAVNIKDGQGSGPRCALVSARSGRRGDRITTFFIAPQNVRFWHKADICLRCGNVMPTVSYVRSGCKALRRPAEKNFVEMPEQF
jgi:putative ABC transport system substrate-binding protein